MENKPFEIDKTQVLEVMDFNKVDAVLVTSGGAIYHPTSKQICASECARLQQEYREVTRAELTGSDMITLTVTLPDEKALKKMTIDLLHGQAAIEKIKVTKTKKDEIVAEILAGRIQNEAFIKELSEMTEEELRAESEKEGIELEATEKEAMVAEIFEKLWIKASTEVQN